MNTPNQKAFLRFRKNKPAVIGFIYIALAVLVAIFGYWLAPDQTPDANEQNTEVSLVEAGFTISMIKVRKNIPASQTTLLEHLIAGKPNVFDYIPYKTYNFIKDSISIATIGGDTIMMPLCDVFYAMSINDAAYKVVGETIYFKDITEKTLSVTLNELQQRFKSEQLCQKTYYLGTDKFGRCMLSRLIIGVRISLLVGLLAVLISLLIGIVAGAVAGFFSGWIDDLITLIMNVIWSIPTVLLVFAIVLALGRGIGNIFLAVGLTMWVDVARMVRGQVLSLKKMQYVEATAALGYSTMRTILRHLLPNILAPVMVIAASNFATAILLEAGLSYLGFGIRPPTPSWGTMLNETYGYAIGGRPFLAVVPAVAIMSLVLAFNLLGNGIRDALDVKSKLT